MARIATKCAEIARVQFQFRMLVEALDVVHLEVGRSTAGDARWLLGQMLPANPGPLTRSSHFFRLSSASE